MTEITGAEAIVRTLATADVNVCFTNPGTSELAFLTALDSTPQTRGVLCLFEGVATGAADGYGRMLDRPAAALLHMGVGLAYGLPNLHNARRAHTPVITVVGDHIQAHKASDAPLESDIDTLAATVSSWARRSTAAADAGTDAAAAVVASLTGRGVATLIVPSDVAGAPAARPATPPATCIATVTQETIEEITSILQSGEPTTLLLGGRALRHGALSAASRIAAATGARLLGEALPARRERGAGSPAGIDHLSFVTAQARAQLADARHLVLVDARPPVAFFGVPGRPSHLAPSDCAIHTLVEPASDHTSSTSTISPRAPHEGSVSGSSICTAATIETALARLADRLAPVTTARVEPAARPALPTGALTAETFAAVIGALLPEGAIVSDESNASGRFLPAATLGAPPHDWMVPTGGAVGQGVPLAIGAAIACPDRPVISLEADGSLLYTSPALATIAREELNITVVVLNNGAYRMLDLELALAHPHAGPVARSLVDLSHPALDFASLAGGMGIPATIAWTADDLATQLDKAVNEPGPHLIDARIPTASS